jgi:hypothetical protein
MPVRWTTTLRGGAHKPLMGATLAGLLGVLAGCQSVPAAEAPPLSTRVDHYAGSPLSGPTARAPADQPPEDVPEVLLTVVALDPPAPDLGTPLGPRIRLIAARREDVPVQPSGRLTQATRLLLGPGVPREWNILTRDQVPLVLRGALPVGVTATFEVADLAPVRGSAPGQPTHRAVALHLAQSTEKTADPALAASLTVIDAAEPAASADGSPAASSRPAPPALQRETAFFDLPWSHGGTILALIVPFRLTGTAAQSLALLVQVMPGRPDARHRSVVARCREDVARSRKAVEQRPKDALAANPEAVALGTALAQLDLAAERRAALVFLANRTGAALATDLALTADDAFLEHLAAAVKSRMPADLSDRTAVGWQTEQAAFATVVTAGAKEKLPPEVVAVLTAHYGEAGRHAASLEELHRRMTSPGEFAARVEAENLTFLEDDAPGARVRAYHWLAARRRAPAGYDPLAAPRERRAALDRAQGLAPAPAGDRP